MRVFQPTLVSSSIALFSTELLFRPQMVRALSSATSSTARSPAAKIMAQNFEAFQIAKLKEAGLLGVQRPFRIVAENIDAASATTSQSQDTPDELVTTKTVHFQRHGQGYHNLIGEMYREFHGKSIDLDCKDPSQNPFLRAEMCDSPLTEKGRLECAARRTEASLLRPEVVIVSPLHRAIQTAILSFADHMNDDSVRWVAHEGVREQTGLLQCNKRRALSETRQEFPHIDYSAMMNDDTDDDGLDVMWDPEERESPHDETQRIYNFLTEFLMHQKEENMAVVGHSAWLFTMCNAILEIGDDADLKALFSTSEIRSMRLSFYKTSPTNGEEA